MVSNNVDVVCTGKILDGTPFFTRITVNAKRQHRPVVTVEIILIIQKEDVLTTEGIPTCAIIAVSPEGDREHNILLTKFAEIN